MPHNAAVRLLNATAWRILHALRAPVREAIEVRAGDDGGVVRVVLSPPGLDGAPEERPGKWLSALELIVWRALDGKVLSGKALAAQCGEEYGPKIKYLLLNLEERGVITHDPGQGYSRAGLPRLPG